MIHHYDLALTDEPDEDGFRPFMSAYILGGEEGEDLRPALVICPGGGYESVCEYWEDERYAMVYAAAGLNAIVVNYTTCRGGRYPRQLKELARALEITREHAEELFTQRILCSRSMFPREYNWHKMLVDRLADVFGL